MTKKEIVKQIADRIEETQLKTKEIVQLTFEAIVDTLISDRRIELAPCDGSARDAGISQQVHRPSLADAKPGVYPTDLATLGLIAESADPVLHCAAETTPLKVRIARGSTSSA